MSATHYFSAHDLFSAPFLAPEQVGKQLGNSLILAPHPDDEALGCGGMIQFLLEQQITVHIGFVTSGDASHPNSKRYPPQRLGLLREEEARQSCTFLGVPEKNVFFMRLADGRLHSLTSQEREKSILMLAEYISTFNIDSLLLPWQRDPHPDHRVTYALGKAAMAKSANPIQLVEYPIWLWKNSSKKDWPQKDERQIFKLDISSKLPKKKEAIYAHQSQTTSLIDDDAEGFVLTDDLLAPFLAPYEFYFFQKPDSLLSLSEKYFDALYQNNSDPWNFRNSEYEKSKYETIDKFLKDKTYNRALELGCSIGVHTAHLAKHCKTLLAVDICEIAIATAKANSALPNVLYEKSDIVKAFPPGPFDFISMCEMGYYFNTEALNAIFAKIATHLEVHGHFLLVHWTSFVREYPLDGRQVHQLFEAFAQHSNAFTLLSSYSHERFELSLWKKNR